MQPSLLLDNNTIFCGIDNGTSGSIAIIAPDVPVFWAKTPIKKCQNYQKHEKFLHRVDAEALFDIFHDRIFIPVTTKGYAYRVSIERPYCNPSGFNASLIAARSLEATILILDALDLSYTFVDSKQWQTMLLPPGTEKKALKVQSKIVGQKIFPDVKFVKDADSLLIAEWLRRTYKENE